MEKPLAPLGGLRVVNHGAGLAPVLISKFLAELGARVTRVSDETGEFAEIYPAYEVLRRHEKPAAVPGVGLDALMQEVAGADICIVGGEDHPDLSHRIDAGALLDRHPRLIVVEISGYPPGVSDMGNHAVDILVQARSGICYEYYSDRPNFMTFQPTHYGAAMQGLVGALGALCERETSGRGQWVGTSLYEGALCWVTTWSQAENSTPLFKFSVPLDPRPILLQCRDGVYVHVCLGARGSKAALYRILGIDSPGMDPNDAGKPNPAEPPELFFGDIDLLSSYAQTWTSDKLLDALTAAGLPGEIALPPGVCWEHPQVRINGIIQTSGEGVRYVGSPVSIIPGMGDSPANRPAGEGPLGGMVVLDFGAFVAGPATSVILSDLGAEVIKVEPVTGDPMRGVVRLFNSANRGKKSVAVDLKSSEGANVVRRLCEKADIVTSNFRPGVSAKLGIDADTLHSINPSLIVLEAPGYGATGPNAAKGAFDPILQALCGHEYRAGGESNPPLWTRAAMVDYTGGMLGAIAILAATFQRARTGAGAEIVSPLLNAGVFLLSELAFVPGRGFIGAPVANRYQTGFHPAEAMYQAADDWIAVALRGNAAARGLAEVLGLERELSKPYRQWGDAEASCIGIACRAWGSEELLAALRTKGVWCEPCRRGMERSIFNNSDLYDRGTLFDHDYRVFGKTSAIGPLFSYDRSQVMARGGSPQLGEHTREVLMMSGYAAAEVDALYGQGAVS